MFKLFCPNKGCTISVSSVESSIRAGVVVNHILALVMPQNLEVLLINYFLPQFYGVLVYHYTGQQNLTFFMLEKI